MTLLATPDDGVTCAGASITARVGATDLTEPIGRGELTGSCMTEVCSDFPRKTPTKKTEQRIKIQTILANKICSVVVVINIGLLLLAKAGIRSTLLGLEGENSSNNSC